MSAVIDFGCLGVGDPAVDLMVAWVLFDRPSRKVFRECLQHPIAPPRLSYMFAALTNG